MVENNDTYIYMIIYEPPRGCLLIIIIIHEKTLTTKPRKPRPNLLLEPQRDVHTLSRASGPAANTHVVEMFQKTPKTQSKKKTAPMSDNDMKLMAIFGLRMDVVLYSCWLDDTKPIGSMYAIYGNIYRHLPSIYHQYTPNVSIYIAYMDPMGNGKWINKNQPSFFGKLQP